MTEYSEAEYTWDGLNAALYNQKVYIGSGWTEAGNVNSLRYLDLSENGANGTTCTSLSHTAKTKWDTLPTECRWVLSHGTILTPLPRQNHGQEVQNGFLYLFGGINSAGNVLNELWHQDLEGDKKWATVKLR